MINVQVDLEDVFKLFRIFIFYIDYDLIRKIFN